MFLAHWCRLRPPSTALGQSGGYRSRTGEQMQQLGVRHTAAVIRLVLMVFSLFQRTPSAWRTISAPPTSWVSPSLRQHPRGVTPRPRRARWETTTSPGENRNTLHAHACNFSVFVPVAEAQLLRPLLVHTCSYTLQLHPAHMTSDD